MNTREITKFRDTYTEYAGPAGDGGLALAVTFDEKDEVKRMGAKWNPAPNAKGGYWSMPRNNLNNPTQEWLNDHKMIVGPLGTITPESAQKFINDNAIATHSIRQPEGRITQVFEIYEYFVAVQYDENHTVYMSHDKARELWELSMSDGYRHILHGSKPEPETV